MDPFVPSLVLFFVLSFILVNGGGLPAILFGFAVVAGLSLLVHHFSLCNRGVFAPQLQENARIACGYLWHNLLITSLLEDLLRFFKACRRCLLLPSHLFGFVCCGGVFVISLQPNRSRAGS